MTHFSIIRFVPNEVAEEFINVGAIVCGSQGSRFFDYSTSSRVRSFSPTKLKALRDDVAELKYIFTMVGQPTLFNETAHDHSLLIALQQKFTGVAQVSDPLPSTLPPAEVHAIIERTFLSEHFSVGRERTSVAQLIKVGFEEVVRSVHENWSSEIVSMRRNTVAVGRTELHEFDFSIEHHGAFLSTKALNLDVKSNRDANLQMSAAFYSILDSMKVGNKGSKYSLLVDSDTLSCSRLADRLAAFSNSANLAIVSTKSIGEWACNALSELLGNSYLQKKHWENSLQLDLGLKI